MIVPESESADDTEVPVNTVGFLRHQQQFIGALPRMHTITSTKIYYSRGSSTAVFVVSTVPVHWSDEIQIGPWAESHADS
eukprot:SAG22_NODE_10264_length_544_cov_1.278652_1_plen_79_part_01